MPLRRKPMELVTSGRAPTKRTSNATSFCSWLALRSTSIGPATSSSSVCAGSTTNTGMRRGVGLMRASASAMVTTRANRPSSTAAVRALRSSTEWRVPWASVMAEVWVASVT